MFAIGALGVVVACSSSRAASPDAPEASLDGVAGTFHEQTLVVDGATRTYWLHVPASAIGAPAPLVIDFHGTGYQIAEPEPELEWALDELVAASDALGFIVARPRSHAFTNTGTKLYQWDFTPAEITANRAFAQALVTAIATHYAIDPARTYAAGFSNGTNMAQRSRCRRRRSAASCSSVVGSTSRSRSRGGLAVRRGSTRRLVTAISTSRPSATCRRGSRRTHILRITCSCARPRISTICTAGTIERASHGSIAASAR